MTTRHPQTGLTTCRKCKRDFNLSRQHYFDNICPNCLREMGQEERTYPSCHVCGDKVAPENRTSVKVPGAARDPAYVHLPAHEDCKREHQRNQHAGAP